MLRLLIEEQELWNVEAEQFVIMDAKEYQFEYSLEAIAEWEGIHKMPYLRQTSLSISQFTSMIECMCLDDDIDVSLLSYENIESIKAYISDTPSATTIQNDNKTPSKIITAETIYAMMVHLNIPFECARWNFNRLMMLLSVIGDDVAPKEKMSQQDVLEQNKRLNEERKKALKTKG